jgi:hypothetical protein
VQDAQQFRIGSRVCAALRAHVLEQSAKIAGDVRTKAYEVDVAGFQHGGSVHVFRKCQQQMLQRDGSVPLLARKSMRSLEGFAEVGRHRYRFELVRKRLRHQQTPPSPGSQRPITLG